jgi:hypothetical protein
MVGTTGAREDRVAQPHHGATLMTLILIVAAALAALIASAAAVTAEPGLTRPAGAAF